jgi:hypothetical protein
MKPFKIEDIVMKAIAERSLKKTNLVEEQESTSGNSKKSYKEGSNNLPKTEVLTDEQPAKTPSTEGNIPI